MPDIRTSHLDFFAAEPAKLWIKPKLPGIRQARVLRQAIILSLERHLGLLCLDRFKFQVANQYRNLCHLQAVRLIDGCVL